MHIGKKHGNLGVDMESNTDGIFDISMIKYLQNLMEDFPEVITGRASTPAADHLFSVRDKKEAITLEEDRRSCPTIRSHSYCLCQQKRDKIFKPQSLFLP